MSFNYINVNSPKLFPNFDGTAYNVYDGYLCDINTGLSLPEGINELWVSYDESVHSNYSGGYFNLFFDNVAARYYNGQKMIRIDGKDYNKVGFADSRTHTWIYVKSGTEDGLIEIYNESTLVTSYTGNINNGENFKEITFNYGGSAYNRVTGFKNLIISDTEIGKTETIISMPVTVETDMETTSTEGKYLITEHGQKYMMTPDIMKLAETFDLENVMVRRASIVSNSASSAFGNDISVLKAMKNNETLAEVEMIENDDNKGIEHAFTVNQTANDFSNDKYGWVAK